MPAPSAREYIAKTGGKDGTKLTRSVLGHCADVAVAFHQLVTPRLRELLGVNDVQLARLCVIAGLHDLGKTRAEWQDYIWSVAGGPPAPRTGHVAPTLAALLSDDAALVEALGEVADWTADPAATWYTTICHHGGPVPEHVWRRDRVPSSGGDRQPSGSSPPISSAVPGARGQGGADHFACGSNICSPACS